MFGWFKRRREAKERVSQIANTPVQRPTFENVKRVPTRPVTFRDTYRPSTSDNSSTDFMNTIATAAVIDSISSSSSSYDPTPSYSGGDFGGGGSSGSWDSSSSSCSYDSSSSSSYDSSSSCSSSFD